MKFAIKLLVILSVVSGLRADWRQFRGPGGLGVSDEKELPAKWSSKENIIWQTKLPGPGGSSPIVLGDRVYLTCYSGYGLKPGEGDQKDLLRHVLCLDRKTGKVNWSKELKPTIPESKYSGGTKAKHGYSTSTPTTDGERLYVFFGKSGVYCFDLDGKEIWHTDVGSGTRGWGSGASPVLYKDLLIVNASVESRTLIALDKKSGKKAWEVENFRGVWGTPLLVTTDKGETELVTKQAKENNCLRSSYR